MNLLILNLVPQVGGWRLVFTWGEPPVVQSTGFWPATGLEKDCEHAKEQLETGNLAAIVIYPGNDEAAAKAAAKQYGFTYSDEVPPVVATAAT